MAGSGKGMSMATKTGDETERAFTVVTCDEDGNFKEWPVRASDAVVAVGRGRAAALLHERGYGFDFTTWGGFGLGVVSVAEGHRLELLGREVSLWKDRAGIDAAMKAALEEADDQRPTGSPGAEDGE